MQIFFLKRKLEENALSRGSLFPQEYRFPCKGVFPQPHRLPSIPSDLNSMVNSELPAWRAKPASSSESLLPYILQGRILYFRIMLTSSVVIIERAQH